MHSYVSHVTFMCVTSRVRKRHVTRMTRSYLSHSCVSRDAFVCVTFMCVTRRVCMCHVTHSKLQGDGHTETCNDASDLYQVQMQVICNDASDLF